jgi:hypothetical protein
MSEIHINRSGQSLGTFTLTEVQEGLDGGKYLGSDLGWRVGMENWKPLAQWADLTIPKNVAAILPPSLVLEASLPSWEQRSEQGFFTAFGNTAKEVLLEPGPTFARMKESGGFMTPFLYMLISTGLGVFLSFAVQFGLQIVMGSIAASQNPEISRALADSGATMGFIFGFLLALPIFLFLGSFIGSAIWHVSLMLLGGATKPYEATYRVYCYVTGSSTLVSMVPCCGGLAAIVWKIVSGAIGLSKVHGISTGKAVAAILLPMIVCCGACGVVFYFSFHALQGNAEFMSSLENLLKGR